MATAHHHTQNNLMILDLLKQQTELLQELDRVRARASIVVAPEESDWEEISLISEGFDHIKISPFTEPIWGTVANK